eukprot:TRINITY_DN14247_c0_g1_i3.p1 TRINITY_DN14247_c0_g1~~TRINITY_DN14247_c0_g1_i3.p1  ORF type:complete len:425 (+),score=69.01 TRINITY_DN14247_c0_g1_i3:338-1612(+)
MLDNCPLDSVTETKLGVHEKRCRTFIIVDVTNLPDGTFLRVISSGSFVSSEESDHAAVWYLINISTSFEVNLEEEITRSPRLAFVCFQESNSSEVLENDIKIVDLPWQGELYSFGCSSADLRNRPPGSNILATKGVRLLVFGEKMVTDEFGLKEFSQYSEYVEYVPIKNNLQEQVFVVRKKKGPTDTILSFDSVFEEESLNLYKQTHVCAIGISILRYGQPVLVVCGTHLSFTGRNIFPALVDSIIRRKQINLIGSKFFTKFLEVPILLFGDVNLRTRPKSFISWEKKTPQSLLHEFHEQDWPLGLSHSYWPTMKPEDWYIHHQIWKESHLWKSSEAITLVDDHMTAISSTPTVGNRHVTIHLTPPNFPPTYRCTQGLQKNYDLLRVSGAGKSSDLLPPSWLDMLLILVSKKNKNKKNKKKITT